MDLGNVIFSVYFFGAVLVGVYLIREVDFGDDNVLIKKKGKKLGPTYWGSYQGTPTSDDESMQTIVPPKPTKDSDGVAGGKGYSTGKAVKSGRV